MDDPTDDLPGLQRALVRARAFEDALAGVAEPSPATAPTDPSSPARPRNRALSPAVPAAWALSRETDGSGDVFSIRTGSPAAALVFGLEPDVLFRQALGRATATAAGRDPGGFPTDLRRGLIAPVSPPGTLVEVLAGAALAFRMRDEPRVALLVDDADGSASGYWHEGLNFAAVRRAPFVLVVDASRRHPLTARVAHLSERGPAYGVVARTVDGGDPVSVLAAVREAVHAAREGAGAHMVEITGRTSDPVATLTGRLHWSEQLEDPRGAELETAARDEMSAALARVVDEPAPGADDARSPVFAGADRPGPPFVRPTTSSGRAASAAGGS